MKNDKQRLFEVMGRLDKTFKPTKAILNEGFEDIEATEVPVDADNEMPVDGEEGIEVMSAEDKIVELTAKVDELYGMLHGEEEAPAEELPAEPEAGEMGIDTGEVIQEWNFDKKKDGDDEGKGETPAEEKEEVDEDVTITVSEKKGKALSADKAPEVEIGK